METDTPSATALGMKWATPSTSGLTVMRRMRPPLAFWYCMNLEKSGVCSRCSGMAPLYSAHR